MSRVVLIWSWNAGEGVLRGRTRRLNVGSWASWIWVGDAATILCDLIWERVVGEGSRTGDGAECRTVDHRRDAWDPSKLDSTDFSTENPIPP